MPHTSEHGPQTAVPLSDDTRAALVPVLGRGERVDQVATGVGCTLVLTDRQLLLIRDGAHFRPRSGVRSWRLDRATGLRLTPAQHATSRLVIADGTRSASVFVTADQLPDMNAIVAAVRRLTHANPDDPSHGLPA
jgi:hypothetical protein